ncbi:MAG: ParB/RepB/Spo0J family partition protein [Bacteroidia bacterium]|jgi:ParB family chromosome partitioning protein
MNPKRNALGRGLGALLASPETDITTRTAANNDVHAVGGISNLPVNQIEANPFQPRSFFEEEALNELAESIRHMGLIQPVTVRKMGYDKYQLISGERRFRASQLAGLKEIPAYIRIANDQAMLEMALVENIQREELDAIEIALAYQRMLEELKLTQEEVSEKVAKKRSTVTNYLRLLKLPPEIQLGLRARKITMGHARALINLEDPATQMALYQQIVSQELSVRDIETAVRETKTENKGKPARVFTSPLMSRAINLLNQRLSVPVDIKSRKNGKGQINIPFKSEQQLNEILRILLP